MKNSKIKLTWLQISIALVLALGIFFRFVNLDRKVYWHDETFTSLRISGYTGVEVAERVFNGRLINRDDLQTYQQLNPDFSVIDTVEKLASIDAIHPPLYYAMVHGWAQLFGSSVAAIRSLSATLSLLVFPCLYWLCLELFESPLVAWVAIALFAVSPFHVLYAQEARQYSLWTATILLSSAALVRAMRVNTKRSWGIYAATLVVGLYTALFSGLVAIAHGIYVVFIERCRFSRKLVAYALSSLAALLGFAPWLWVIITNASHSASESGWSAVPMDLLSLIKIWILNIGRIFIDGEFSVSNPLTYLVIPIAIAVGYAIYFLCRNTPQRVWLFILTLIGVTSLIFVLPDLILGGRRSTVLRYLIPTWVGLQLAVAYLFAAQITSISNSLWRQKLWQTALALLISLGILSCIISSQSSTWWNKFADNSNVDVARIINQAPQPLLISDVKLGHIMSLSYLLSPKVQLMLISSAPDIELNVPKIPERFSDTFVFKPTKLLKDKLKQEYPMKSLLKERDTLFRLGN